MGVKYVAGHLTSLIYFLPIIVSCSLEPQLMNVVLSKVFFNNLRWLWVNL